MVAYIIYKDKDKEGVTSGGVIRGDDLRIVTNALTNEIKILDGEKRCIFWSYMENVSHAYIDT